MRVFPFDILAGIILALGILSIIIGILALRYKGGKGPIMMILSGVLLLISSILWLLVSLDHISIPYPIMIMGWCTGGVFLVISLVLWRGRG